MGTIGLAVAVLLAAQCSFPATAVTSVVWAVTGLGQCNSTCPAASAVSAPSHRGVEFGCYASNSDALVSLPQTSPRLFAVKSADGRLPDDRCLGIPLPAVRTVECPAADTDCADSAVSAIPVSGHTWRWNLEGDIKCSARCNHVGVLSVPIDCVDSSGASVKTHFCQLRRVPPPDLSLPCYQLDGCSPVWKAGPWGACSRDCGLGEIDRKVECYQLVDSATGPYYQLRRGQCSHSEDKPHLREYCLLNRACQPHYRTAPGKCRLRFSASNSEHRLCNETGLIVNSPQCVQLTADLRARSNVTAPVDPALCRQLGLSRPPPFTKCQVDAETLRQHGIKCANPSLAREPQFTLVSSLLVQMERRESLQVNCGQSATVIPGTLVRLHCKVANFKALNLKWKRPDGTEVTRSAKCRRVCVIDGDLVIEKFRPKDSGLYQVIADSQIATLSLHSHSAYDAYVKSYLPRMLLLQPNSVARQQAKYVQLDTPNRETLLWMPGPWSACSVPCGGSGQRNRSVQCEQLQSSAFTIVNGRVCQEQLGEPPVRAEPCGSHTCPVWRVSDWDEECSIRHCYSPGFSLLTRQVKCVNQANEPLHDSHCEHEKKPETVHKCRNQLCQPMWQANPWSPCSVSCGAHGFSSRQIRCLWQPSGRPAGFACESAALEHPKSFKACYTGACERLGCLDLSPVCSIYQASALCAHPSLRRNCCKTCGEYQLTVYQNLATRVSRVSKTAA